MLKGRMRRSLDRNPIGWLQEFRWSTRISKWGWCLFLVICEIGVTSATLDPSFSQRYMALLLMGGMVVAAAVSFQRELESGAMELILVTPITEAKVITGRLKGLYRQFLPAVGLIFGIEIFLITQVYRTVDPRNISTLAQLFGGFLFIPVIGIYWSMQKKPVIVLFLKTFAWALIIPYALARGGVFLSTLSSRIYYELHPVPMTWMFIFAQGSLALIFYRKLLNYLRSRSFVSQSHN